MQAKRKEMAKTVRARYTKEFKQEAVRLVAGEQSTASAARSLGVVEQSLLSWVKAARPGKHKGADRRIVSLPGPCRCPAFAKKRAARRFHPHPSPLLERQREPESPTLPLRERAGVRVECRPSHASTLSFLVSAEQAGISRLRAKPARVKMECDILEKERHQANHSLDALPGERVLRESSGTQASRQGRSTTATGAGAAHKPAKTSRAHSRNTALRRR